jgi:DNA-binding transcriptional LysR family regulator
MDSEALKTFLCVHRTGSVSAAAKLLSRTQSAISRRLAVLEDQVGLPLFERVGRRIVTSDAGRTLLPFAERVAAALDDAQAAAERVRDGTSGTVRVAAVGTLADERLTLALRRVAVRYPDVDIRLRTATSAEVSELVRAGEATLGLRYFMDRRDGLSAKLVKMEPLVVACATTHRLAARRVAALDRLATERWLAFPIDDRDSELFAKSVVAQFLSRGVVDVDWVAIDSLTAQKRLVEAGFGVALLQASAIREEVERKRLATIAVGDLDVAVPIVSVTRPGARLAAAAEALLSALQGAPGRKGKRPV